MSLPGAPKIEDVCSKAARLPCSPTLLPRLSKALGAEGTTAADLEEIILLDPSLASATLRLANSAFFGAGHECETVSEAILRLGFREIYRVAVTTLGSRWFNQPVEGYGWEPGDFCRHSLCVAVAADKLAELTGKVDRELAYTAGLIQDIGKLAVAFACSEYFPAIRDYQGEKGCPWWQAEQQVLGYHQAEVGARLLEFWHFPENLTVAARYVDRPGTAPAEHLSLLAHLHGAKFVALAIGAGVAEDGFLMDFDASLLLAHEFTPERLFGVQPLVLETVTKMLKERMAHGPVVF